METTRNCLTRLRGARGKEEIMAKLVYGLNQSLDGYVEHTKFSPSPALFRHFIEHVRGLAGMVYGRRLYEVMRYWDEDQSDCRIALVEVSRPQSHACRR